MFFEWTAAEHQTCFMTEQMMCSFAVVVVLSVVIEMLYRQFFSVS